MSFAVTLALASCDQRQLLRATDAYLEDIQERKRLGAVPQGSGTTLISST